MMMLKKWNVTKYLAIKVTLANNVNETKLTEHKITKISKEGYIVINIITV